MIGVLVGVSLALTRYDSLPMQINATTVICPGMVVSRDERANCTITTRNAKGEPTAGAQAEDLRVFHAPELSDPSPMQGGPIHWFLDFATCKAGTYNVTVAHGMDFNVTTEATVVPSHASNFTLDCRKGRSEVTAGERVVCDIVTQDGCLNPTETPPESEARWTVKRFGSALDDGDIVLPVYDAAEAEAAGVSGGPLLTSAYAAAFRTGSYWTPALNYTERGTGGLEVTYRTANWTEVRWSSVRIRAAPLAASRTRIACYPAGGLLEGHIATCQAKTFDIFDNPQTGATSTDFAVTYLSNPAAQLGSDGGFLQPTVRTDTFEIRFPAIDEGTAGIVVAIDFSSHLAAGVASTAIATGTITVKRSELVLFPSSAVMKVPIVFTVGLDASGAVHDLTLLRFVAGGQTTSGLDGGCSSALVEDEQLGFSADTSSSAQAVKQPRQLSARENSAARAHWGVLCRSQRCPRFAFSARVY